jgi:histidyl-tRNA synthetase
MKQADRRGARYTVLLDAEEPTLLRDMATGDQRSVDDEALAEELQPPTT